MFKKIIACSLATLLSVGMLGMTSHAESTYNFNFSSSGSPQYSSKGYLNNLSATVTVAGSNLSSTKKVSVNMVNTNYSSVSSTLNLEKRGVRWYLPYVGNAYLKGTPNAIGVYVDGVWSTP